MNCKHKDKERMYVRKRTTWSSREIWECQDCNAILGIAEIKVRTMKITKGLSEKTKFALQKHGE